MDNTGYLLFEIASCALIFIAGVFLAFLLGRLLKVPLVESLTMYLWHSALCVCFALYNLENGGDALGYFQKAETGELSWDIGTSSISIMAFPLVSLLDFPFLAVSLFFGLFGFVGLIILRSTLIEVSKNKSRSVQWFAALIVYLPSLNFWTSGIGKDGIAFLSISLAVWAFMYKRKSALLFAVVLMFVVRPPMAVLLAFSILFVFALISSPAKKLLSIVVAVSALVIMAPLVIERIGIEAATLNAISDFVANRQGKNLAGGSSIEIAERSVPYRVFSYLFRPMPHEAHNIAALVASTENVLLLLCFLFAIMSLPKRSERMCSHSETRLFLFIYVVISLVILSSITANLGIAARQKWMIVPPMLLILIISLRDKTAKNKQICLSKSR